MYQDPSELQNTKERASLVRPDIPNGTLPNGSNDPLPWVDLQLIGLESFFSFSCSTHDLLVLSDNEIVFICGFEEHNI